MPRGVKIDMMSPDFYASMGKPDLYWPLVNLAAIIIDGRQYSGNEIPPSAMTDTGTSYISLPMNIPRGNSYTFVLTDPSGMNVQLNYNASTGYVQPMTSLQNEFSGGVAVIGINCLTQHHLSFNYTDRHISFQKA